MSAPALELVLQDECRESVGLCRDFDSHAGCFLNILQRPQKAGEFSYSQDISFAVFGIVNASRLSGVWRSQIKKTIAKSRRFMRLREVAKTVIVLGGGHPGGSSCG